MARRKGNQHFPCERLLEELIGAAPMTVADICATTAPEICGYVLRDKVARHITIRTAMKMLTREGVLIEQDGAGKGIIYGGYKRKRPMAYYHINPVLAGVTDGREMRRIMKELGFGTKDYVGTTNETTPFTDSLSTGDSKSAGQWSQMFRVLNKKAEFA